MRLTVIRKHLRISVQLVPLEFEGAKLPLYNVLTSRGRVVLLLCLSCVHALSKGQQRKIIKNNPYFMFSFFSQLCPDLNNDFGENQSRWLHLRSLNKRWHNKHLSRMNVVQTPSWWESLNIRCKSSTPQWQSIDFWLPGFGFESCDRRVITISLHQHNHDYMNYLA